MDDGWMVSEVSNEVYIDVDSEVSYQWMTNIYTLFDVLIWFIIYLNFHNSP